MFKQIATVILFILAGAFGGILVQRFAPSLYAQPNTGPTYVIREEKVYIQENNALKNSVQKAKSFVLGVRSVVSDKKILSGSGLVLTSDGMAVTLAELVPSGSKTIVFYVDGQPVQAQVIKRDIKENLALVKIEKSGLSASGFFMFDQLNLGERVFLVSQIFDPQTSTPGFLTNEGIVKTFTADTVGTNIQEPSALGAPVFDIEGYALGIASSSGNAVTVIPITKIRTFSGL